MITYVQLEQTATKSVNLISPKLKPLRDYIQKHCCYLNHRYGEHSQGE